MKIESMKKEYLNFFFFITSLLIIQKCFLFRVEKI